MCLSLISMVTYSFAQTAYVPGLTVTTNESSYNQGDKIIISGKVSHVIPNALIRIQLWKGGDIVYADKLEPDPDGNYSNTFSTKDPMWTQGTYVVRAIYGDQNIAKTLFILGHFKPTEKFKFFTTDSLDSKISVKMEGGDKFYLNSPNQLIRAFVEIQNKSPSDRHYYMKVIHDPTKKILKDSEIFPMYSGNDLWATHIGYPLLETDPKILNQTLTGKYTIQISTLNGDKTASTQFSIFKSQYDSSISTPEFALPPKVSISANTDKRSYHQGEPIKVTGDVSEILFGYAIGLTVISPNNKGLSINQTLPNSDGSFSYNFDTNKNLFKENGSYKIQLIYGTEDLSRDLFFIYDNSTITSSEPTLEPELIPEIELSPELEKSIFPVWVKNIMRWYLDGVISENELASNFQYLVKEEIIKFD